MARLPANPQASGSGSGSGRRQKERQEKVEQVKQEEGESEEDEVDELANDFDSEVDEVFSEVCCKIDFDTSSQVERRLIFNGKRIYILADSFDPGPARGMQVYHLSKTIEVGQLHGITEPSVYMFPELRRSYSERGEIS
jgi:hypothetical protein